MNPPALRWNPKDLSVNHGTWLMFSPRLCFQDWLPVLQGTKTRETLGRAAGQGLSAAPMGPHPDPRLLLPHWPILTGTGRNFHNFHLLPSGCPCLAWLCLCRFNVNSCQGSKRSHLTIAGCFTKPWTEFWSFVTKHVLFSSDFQTPEWFFFLFMTQ